MGQRLQVSGWGGELRGVGRRGKVGGIVGETPTFHLRPDLAGDIPRQARSVRKKGSAHTHQHASNESVNVDTDFTCPPWLAKHDPLLWRL